MHNSTPPYLERPDPTLCRVKGYAYGVITLVGSVNDQVKGWCGPCWVLKGCGALRGCFGWGESGMSFLTLAFWVEG